MENQKQRILRFLQSGNKLTRLISWSRLGVLEAPARISEREPRATPSEQDDPSTEPLWREGIHR